MQDIKFHQCVKLDQFKNHKIISFIPPDKKFQIANYRLDCILKPIFITEIGEMKKNTKIEFIAKVRSNFK